jgi:hypothetical protein
MSVTTAGSAVSTQHQATQEQIRLAKLIEDKKHDQPEVQEIVRKVLDIVVDSNQEDALLALYDCDYDYEKAVSLLIEKGHEVANEWRTATNHKLTKKQQQKVATTNNGHRDLDENGQQQQRGNGNQTNHFFLSLNLLSQVSLLEVDLVDFNKTEVILTMLIINTTNNNKKMIIMFSNKDNEVAAVIAVVIVAIIEVVIVELIEIINNKYKIQMWILHHCQIQIDVIEVLL